MLRHDRRFVLFLAGLVVFGLSSLIPNPLIPLVQADRIHLSYEQLGWLSLLNGLTQAASYFCWGRRIDRWGPARCPQIAFALICVALLPYACATRGWMLIPFFLAQGISNAAIDLGFISAATQLADPQRVSEYTALQYTVIGVRGIVGPFIGVGLLALGVPMTAIFLLGMTLAMASAWLLGRAGRPGYAPSPARTAGG